MLDELFRLKFLIAALAALNREGYPTLCRRLLADCRGCLDRMEAELPEAPRSRVTLEAGLCSEAWSEGRPVPRGPGIEMTLTDNQAFANWEAEETEVDRLMERRASR